MSLSLQAMSATHLRWALSLAARRAGPSWTASPRALPPCGEEKGFLRGPPTAPPGPGGPSTASPLVRGRRKKRDLLEVMEEEAQELLSHFNHRNVDALLRLTRNTLEGLRRRIHASTLTHFLGETHTLTSWVRRAHTRGIWGSGCCHLDNFVSDILDYY